MSCFGCSKKYGIFCKEYGCPNCGYSYCAKCLKRPIAVPRRNNEICNVCLICYDKLSKINANEKVIDCKSLPGVFGSKGISASFVDAATILDENPPEELSSVLVPQNIKIFDTRTDSSSDIAENLDIQLSKRLKNLKAVNNLPTDDSLNERLRSLTGVVQKNYDKKELLISTDKRSDHEKIHDLLEQFVGETAIDERIKQEKSDTISDIERRLKALRDFPVEEIAGTQVNNSKSFTPSDNEDEETVLKHVMEKYINEAALPSELENELNSNIPLPSSALNEHDQKELPWCNICNEDALYRCKGCDGELFCKQCFKECHEDDQEYRDHIKENYSAPPNFKNNHF